MSLDLLTSQFLELTCSAIQWHFQAKIWVQVKIFFYRYKAINEIIKKKKGANVATLTILLPPRVVTPPSFRTEVIFSGNALLFIPRDRKSHWFKKFNFEYFLYILKSRLSIHRIVLKSSHKRAALLASGFVHPSFGPPRLSEIHTHLRLSRRKQRIQNRRDKSKLKSQSTVWSSQEDKK